jgi:hypothetical protein
MRPINKIADDINNNWAVPYFGAVPYINAMAALDTIDDPYGDETARVVLRYFLVNSAGWRGKEARRVKAEIKSMLGMK